MNYIVTVPSIARRNVLVAYETMSQIDPEAGKLQDQIHQLHKPAKPAKKRIKQAKSCPWFPPRASNPLRPAFPIPVNTKTIVDF